MFCPIQALNDTLEILDSAAGSCQKENARMNPMDVHPAPNSRTTEQQTERNRRKEFCAWWPTELQSERASGTSSHKETLSIPSLKSKQIC